MSNNVFVFFNNDVTRLTEMLPILVYIVQLFLSVRLNNVRPRLPQREDDKIDKANLRNYLGLIVLTDILIFKMRTCDLAIEILLRSHIGLISRPAERSRSPCWNISSMIRCTHLRLMAGSRADALRSAQCSICGRRLVVVTTNSAVSPPLQLSVIIFNSLKSVRCFDISVASTCNIARRHPCLEGSVIFYTY